ncbi:MAG TPA: benzoate-CoA ligase family protein [Chloroflexota bacterium]
MIDLPRRAPGRVFNMAVPLVDRHVAEGRGERPALRSADGELTYAELQALVNRAGNALRSAGVLPEQRVAILLPDGAEFVAAFIGAMKIGAVPVPMNTAARPAELRLMLSDSRARALIGHQAFVAPAQGYVETIFLSGQGEWSGTGPHFSAALAGASTQLDAFPTGVDEPCYWLYSSGTTGSPKGVVHLHGDMLACVTPFAEEVVGITPDDCTFSVARLFFSYGLVNALFLPLLAGATSVLSAERPDVARTLRVVRRFKPTLFFSVPSSYAQLCAALESGSDTPFEGVRLAISAGEPLPEPLYTRWKALTGVEVLDGLGSTEVGYIFCSNVPGQVRPGSSGRLIGDHAARIVDEFGVDVPDGHPGELWVNSASTALHYWNQRQRTRYTFVGEWLRTGDRYVRDVDGYFWYQGRSNDVFKVNGQWVSPLEIESCLLTHGGVLECAVIGTADDAGLVKPRAFVVRRPGTSVDSAELQALVRAQLQPYKYPRWVDFVDELPKTASGKVQRFALHALPMAQPVRRV